MAVSFYSVLPDPDVLLALEPEELAGALIQHFNSLPDYERTSIHPDNFTNPNGPPISSYSQEYQGRVGEALMEAWEWLVREGLMARKPGSPGWYFVTRRGKQINNADQFTAYKKAKLLPSQLLHPLIAVKVSSSFLRGEYDTAVFQAFKEVEVAVRDGAGLAPEDIGTKLMRKAFDPSSGRLTNSSLPESEKESLAHLFAGAIGSYKNPQSHRTVAITDPVEAVEMIMLASHLMKIVDSRKG